MVPPRGNDPHPRDFQSRVLTINTRAALILADRAGFEPAYRSQTDYTRVTTSPLTTRVSANKVFKNGAPKKNLTSISSVPKR